MNEKIFGIDVGAVVAGVIESAQDGLLYDVDGEKLTAAEAAYRAITQRNELRRILKRMLDNPYTVHDIGSIRRTEILCIFCKAMIRTDYGALLTDELRDRVMHMSDCPVLDKDRLLGR